MSERSEDNPSLSAGSKASTLCWLLLFYTSLNRRFKRVLKTTKAMPLRGMAFEPEFPQRDHAIIPNNPKATAMKNDKGRSPGICLRL